jgi:hypothetical protein
MEGKKAINLSEVLQYVALADPRAVLQIYQKAAERLNFKVDNPEDGDDTAILKGMPSLMDVMADAMGGGGDFEGLEIESDIKAQLEKKVVVEGKLEQLKPKDMQVDVKVLSRNDKSQATDVEVLNADVRKVLDETLKQCRALDIYFPYGYGITKNLLRIKKLPVSLRMGSQISITIHFSSWTLDNGKSGISCWPKK